MNSELSKILGKVRLNITKGEYARLPNSESKIIREYYISQLPSHFDINGKSSMLYSKKDTLISHGYDRIVIGDYGAYIEISKDKVLTDNLKIAKGQEYRLTPRYKNTVKYFWFTTKDDSSIKIYYQKRTVSYADYKVGYMYISPDEVVLK